MDEQGKSVLEYIMIYGWIIVVTAIIVIAVAMFISPSSIQGKVCNPRIGNFAIDLETNFGTKEALIILTNQTGRQVENMGITIKAREPNTIEGSLKGITMQPNEKSAFRIEYTNGKLEGEYVIDLQVIYDTSQAKEREGIAQCRGSI